MSELDLRNLPVTAPVSFQKQQAIQTCLYSELSNRLPNLTLSQIPEQYSKNENVRKEVNAAIKETTNYTKQKYNISTEQASTYVKNAMFGLGLGDLIQSILKDANPNIKLEELSKAQIEKLFVEYIRQLCDSDRRHQEDKHTAEITENMKPLAGTPSEYDKVGEV